ncbi:hypothetical protein [Streptomyces canus]|uniref:hypothetical protein n=1 Tax=Streptomyces canus TaxID=58343 RepID=UPI0027D76E23|nr:hypothetical protein [Streptomyces canus]
MPAVTGMVLSLSATLLWWSQHLLLCGRIGRWSLVPGALLADTGTVVLSRGARILVPAAMERSPDEFGPLGLRTPRRWARRPLTGPPERVNRGCGAAAGSPASGEAQRSLSCAR